MKKALLFSIFFGFFFFGCMQSQPTASEPTTQPTTTLFIPPTTIMHFTTTHLPSTTASTTQPSTTTPPTTFAQSTSISIQNFAFSPSSLSISVGTKVTWNNMGSAPHTVTSDSGAFSSSTLSQGQSFTFTFTQPGTYAYHCSIHPSMTSTIIVT